MTSTSDLIGFLNFARSAETNLPDLLPCPNPWCEPSLILGPALLWDSNGVSEAYVECAGCGLEGPRVSSLIDDDDGERIGIRNAEAGAVAAWNTRNNKHAGIIQSVSQLRDRWDHASCQATGDKRIALEAKGEAARIILDQIGASVTPPDYFFGDHQRPVTALIDAIKPIVDDLGAPGSDGWTTGYAHTTDLDRLQSAIAQVSA